MGVVVPARWVERAGAKAEGGESATPFVLSPPLFFFFFFLVFV